MTKIISNDNNLIDAVEDFDYSTQNDEYNKDFIEWRKNSDNPYAFNFKSNENETVFIEGKGFVKDSAQKAEFKTLYKIFRVIGFTLLISLIIDCLAGKLIVMALGILGVNIHTTLSNSLIYGDKIPVVAVAMIKNFIKIALPLQYAQKIFKMPKSVRFPVKYNNYWEIVTALGFSLMLCSVLSIMNVYSEESRDIYGFFSSFASQIPIWRQKSFIAYVIFDVFVVTFISEALYRGLLLSVLRQFGDIFAIGVTSVLCGLMTHKFGLMPGVVAVSVISAIGTLRSGSIFTAVLIRIVYELFFIFRTAIRYELSYDAAYKFSIFTAITGIVLFLITFAMPKVRSRTMFAEYRAHLSVISKVRILVTCFPVLALMLFCIFIGIMEM